MNLAILPPKFVTQPEEIVNKYSRLGLEPRSGPTNSPIAQSMHGTTYQIALLEPELWEPLSGDWIDFGGIRRFCSIVTSS